MTTLTDHLAEIRARAENAASFRDERGVPTLTGFSIPDLSNVIRTDLPALLAAVQAVMELHQPDTVLAVTGDCALEDCDHEDLKDCETVEFVYCLACNALAEGVDPYYSERGMGPVAWPCSTVQAITDALEVQG